MEGRDLEEMLGWPPELLHAPTQRKEKRHKQGVDVDVEGHGEGDGGDRGVGGQRDPTTVTGRAAGVGRVGQDLEFERVTSTRRMACSSGLVECVLGVKCMFDKKLCSFQTCF
jgi:hypothetical protein